MILTPEQLQDLGMAVFGKRACPRSPPPASWRRWCGPNWMGSPHTGSPAFPFMWIRLCQAR